MSRMRGLYLLDQPIYELVYTPDVRQAIGAHVEMIAPPQTRQSLMENPGLLGDVEVIFSGWGRRRSTSSFSSWLHA